MIFTRKGFQPTRRARRGLTSTVVGLQVWIFCLHQHFRWASGLLCSPSISRHPQALGELFLGLTRCFGSLWSTASESPASWCHLWWTQRVNQTQISTDPPKLCYDLHVSSALLLKGSFSIWLFTAFSIGRCLQIHSVEHQTLGVNSIEFNGFSPSFNQVSACPNTQQPAAQCTQSCKSMKIYCSSNHLQEP